jgi:hypothetical protein
MDIEEFYAADERRRQSEEIEVGRDWRDRVGTRYEVSWVVDTGELYAMREPTVKVTEDAFGDIFGISVPLDQISVAVIASIPTRDQLEEVLDGWTEAMNAPDGMAWLAARLRDRGVSSAVAEGREPPR